MRYTREIADVDRARDRLLRGEIASYMVEVTKSGRLVVKEYPKVNVTLPPRDTNRRVSNLYSSQLSSHTLYTERP